MSPSILILTRCTKQARPIKHFIKPYRPLKKLYRHQEARVTSFTLLWGPRKKAPKPSQPLPMMVLSTASTHVAPDIQAIDFYSEVMIEQTIAHYLSGLGVLQVCESSESIMRLYIHDTQGSIWPARLILFSLAFSLLFVGHSVSGLCSCLRCCGGLGGGRELSSEKLQFWHAWPLSCFRG